MLAEPIRRVLQELGYTTPTEPQEKAVQPILDGKNVLLIAPTGSGKTEAALLPILHNLLQSTLRQGISILYITPLRALNRDMLKRLLLWAARLNITVEVRHGDTPQPQRRRQSVKPPNLLITTPETLQAILPAERMRSHLKGVRWVVVDEVHELAQDKRGAQLTIALERLREITNSEFQRVGVSATVGTPDIVAGFLGGVGRDVEIIHVPVPREYKYQVEHPYPAEEDHEAAQALYTSPEAAARIMRVKELVDTHTSTLVFVNSRQHAEMLGLRLTMLDPRIGVHHGSLSREERHRVEDEFKQGKLPSIVCTSTLELGIDIGTVDLVVQYMSPRQVAPLIQRVGRSGHRVGLTSEGVIITTFTEDTLESIAAVGRAREERLEAVKVHEDALDVLGHQITGLVMDSDKVRRKDAYTVIKRAYLYRNLGVEAFDRVIDYLERLGLVGVEGDYLVRRRRTRPYYYENLSMIPDERRYPVVDLTTDRRVGTLGDEFMSTKAKVGLNFIIRGLVWRIMEIAEDGTVYVTPVEDPTAAIPGWDGEIIPVPFELAQEMGGMRRKIAEMVRTIGKAEAVEVLVKELPTERYAIRRVLEEIEEQIKMGAPIPTDRLILLEGYDRFLIFHGCFGEQVNRTLGYIFDYALSQKGMVRNWWADGYRILIELSVNVAESDFDGLARTLASITPKQAEEAFDDYVKARFPFSYYMKFVAQRFGALERGIFLGDEELSELPIRFSNTPVYEETLREALLEKVDLQHTAEVLNRIREGSLKVETRLSLDRPTPIAYHILNKYAEVPEMMAPETTRKDAVDRMKNAILASIVELTCLNCGEWEGESRVKDLAEKPLCPRCGQGLLAVFRRPNPYARTIIKKRLRGDLLSEDEHRILIEARRSADLVLSYGKRAIMALLVHGVGPQTASRILAKMHYTDEDLYRDLIEAKIRYIQTRQYWDEK